MELSELVIHRGDGGPLVVRFEPTVAVLNISRPEATRVRLALESLFQGSTDFGRARLRIDEVEIEVTPELAKHLALHYGPRSQILDRVVADRLGGEGDLTDGDFTDGDLTDGRGTRADPAGTVALRAALELLRAVALKLDRRSVEAALRTVQADRNVLATGADMAVVEAANHKAEAELALSKINYWRASVGPLHERSIEARKRARRRLSGPLSYRRYSRLRQEEMELLEAGDFDSYEEFLAYADDAEVHYQEALDEAARTLDAAERRRAALDADGTGLPEADLLMVQEFVLRLRLRQLASASHLSEDDRRSLFNALSIMMELGHGIRLGTGERLVDAALARLAATESDRLRRELRRRAAIHAEPLPAVGTVPLVLDGFLEGAEPSAADRALTSLDPFVGRVQIVAMRPDPPVLRWAANHRPALPNGQVPPVPPPTHRLDAQARVEPGAGLDPGGVEG